MSNFIEEALEKEGRYSSVPEGTEDKLEKSILLKAAVGGQNVIPLTSCNGQTIRVIHILFDKLKDENDIEYTSMTLADEAGQLYRTSGDYAKQIVLKTVELFGLPTKENPYVYEVKEIQSKKNASWKYVGLDLKVV